MIAVVGDLPCAGVTVESDPWIPLTVTWPVPRSGQPLYLRVSGVAGGELEFKVDPVSGALLEAIVIDSPPAARGLSALPAADPPADRAPVLDRSRWGLGEPPDPHRPARRVVSDRTDVRMTTVGAIVTLSISRAPAVRHIGCGPVRVGVGVDGELVGLVVLNASA